MDKQIKKYMKEYIVNFETAQTCATEFKRWLIVSEELQEPLEMFSEEVDNFWHICILYTKEYAHFCNDCFGKFIHHIPLE